MYYIAQGQIQIKVKGQATGRRH